MNAFAKVVAQPMLLGTCQGTIDGTEEFRAGLVELSEATYPPPHGEAYVMLATQRRPGPDYTTKELKVSFSKGYDEDDYGLTPEDHVVRVLFIDSSIPAKPVVYSQSKGIARVVYDSDSSTFSGTVCAELENLDEDTRRIVNIKVDFATFPNVRNRRIPRRPSPRAHC
ncbi:hypothetical protein [Pseudomonas sp. NPDC089534]|uniref:hypothetical protein n=1 Tax=Pseudomonas sp. NPDC089534 TaxID=3364468 RepID=UPI003804D228